MIPACSERPGDNKEENGIVSNARVNSWDVSEIKPSFKATGFSSTCDSLILNLKDNHNFGSVRIDPENTFLWPKEFIKVLKELKDYDLIDSSQIDFKENRCHNLKSSIWAN